MRRDPLGALLLSLLILGFGLVVWATRYPESELLERAEQWPVAGPLVERFRARYVTHPEGDRGQQKGRHEAGMEEGREAAGAQGTEQQRSTAVSSGQKVVWVKAGTMLRRDADAQAPAVETVTEVTRLPVLEHDGDWYRVLSRDRLGWVRLPDYGRNDEPPLGSEPAAPRPLPGRIPDRELLEMAIDLLRQPTEPSRLGGYQFFTDYEDPSLVGVLDGVAGDVERAYVVRYGVEPIDRPRETIVLYDREHDYRALQNSLEAIAGLPAVGLVSRGVVAVYVGGRDDREVAATLVHELVHLLNRRALGPALPPWLDEGLADDMSYSRLGESGELAPDELGGSTVDLGSVRIWKGGRAAALELRRALVADRAVPLQGLVALDWRAFVNPEMRLHYPQSALLVRYLIESDAALRAGFHAYLRGIARGGSVAPETLLECLGRSWTDLEAGFRDWTLARFARLSEEAR